MRGRRVILWATIAAALAAVSSCAYFNTLYNAKKTYEDAQKAERIAAQPTTRQPIEDTGDVARVRAQQQAAPAVNKDAYDQVITKCKHLIARYPDSKYVDDAMLLIGRSLFALGHYDECASALDSLTSRYPKTDLRHESEFLKGKALSKGKHYDDAVETLTSFVDTYRKDKNRPEALYLLCTCQMQLGLSDNAVASLARLEKDHGRSDFRYHAQTDMAAILVDKGMYKESLAVYERLSSTRIPTMIRVDVWMGMSRSQIELKQYQDALTTLHKLHGMPLPPDKEPSVVLLRARASAGADSTLRAIALYNDVIKRFTRTMYGAEAAYRLGTLYESMDSLKTAQHCYQEVPRAYSASEFADDAIKRASDIGRMLRLQQSAGDNSPEAVAMRTFSMAELQLLQFNSTEKAIPNYEKIVNDYPDSEFAPRSAYALGYIYGVVLGDSAKARAWYDVLRTRYADSQQAQLAYVFYKGATPPPPIPEMMKFTAAKHPAGNPAPAATPAAPDTTHAVVPVPEPPHAKVLPDSLREPVPQAAPDTTSAPPDTSSHGH